MLGFFSSQTHPNPKPVFFRGTGQARFNDHLEAHVTHKIVPFGAPALHIIGAHPEIPYNDESKR